MRAKIVLLVPKQHYFHLVEMPKWRSALTELWQQPAITCAGEIEIEARFLCRNLDYC